jgi:hypothetical protein
MVLKNKLFCVKKKEKKKHFYFIYLRLAMSLNNTKDGREEKISDETKDEFTNMNIGCR